MMKFSIRNNGFTVVETMIAVLVASMAIAGASFAASGSIRAGSIAKEEVKAFYLAQEALEFLANRRDTNEITTLNGTTLDWLSGIAALASDPCYPGKLCIVDPYNSTTPLVECNGGCPVLRQNPNDYRIGYDQTWNPTQYRREISLERTSTNEVSVAIRITWGHAGQTREFRTKSLLTNWFTSSANE